MEELNSWLLYLIAVNIVGFLFMGLDKKKAKKQEFRIPERTLWGIAILGGALGSFLGMRVFRHKTKHTSFKIGMPFLIIAHAMLIYYLMS